jgi:hypothetical protein
MILTDITLKYTEVIFFYLENYNMSNRNTSDNIQNILHGIKTISNVYKLGLLYTGNIHKTQSITHNAVFYYLEFLNQMPSVLKETNGLLELTEIDASIFVYKKTIYGLKPVELKLSTSEKIFYKLLGDFIQKSILVYAYTLDKTYSFSNHARLITDMINKNEYNNLTEFDLLFK